MASRIESRGPLGQKAPKPEKGAKKPRKPIQRKAPPPRQKTPISWKPKRRTTSNQKHIEAVKTLPCVICGAPGPSDAHHSICDRYSQRKAPDAFCVPLCKAHHQNGPEAIHADKAGWVARWGPDWAYLPDVYAALGKPVPPKVQDFIKERLHALHQ